MTARWKPCELIRLLENGDEFYVAAFAAIEAAQGEIFVETFILQEDKVGKRLAEILTDAAKRGVHVELTIDGYGSPDLSAEFTSSMVNAGVHVNFYDRRPRALGFRTNVFHRLHRKLLVVDGKRAFVGGINFSEDHLIEFGPQAKQDYAVEVEGPIVDDILATARELVAREKKKWWQPRLTTMRFRCIPLKSDIARSSELLAMFTARDNHDNRTSIEKCYRAAIQSARHSIIIANAYFFPGYRLLKDIKDAAERGVDVRLIIQGKPDLPITTLAARRLYPFLLSSGVKIFEYCERSFHGKVAVVDGHWSTVGSSNLDPFSLALNLEANLFIENEEFSGNFEARLKDLVTNHCSQVEKAKLTAHPFIRMIPAFVVFHILRHFPSWAALIPSHEPEITVVSPDRT